ncbi:MAG TPA: FAD-dependent monooxygenase [Chitinophagaceae bacterium]|nr:FAD-dependent monooxygenase [Chitinophagaceae bacterium]HNJ26531.1 FAD-dependent monooxygenase [Chitinophagaceae bacterium]HNJ56424.1 FAD-dependent monooxygenase [Chitinophagaceae bacterium]HNK61279.1 FAD-dependent monooxygenase [Chitinophagaceae bacterium]
MQKAISLKLLPEEAATDNIIKAYIAGSIGNKPEDISGFIITKKSIDARGKQAWVNLTLTAYINEPVHHREKFAFQFQDIKKAKKSVIIIGAGPAGLFAALKLIELGIKPVLLERGKDVRARRRDLAMLNKEGEINTESNYCFGEGGAGTYSDGKLYTRSSKRGSIERILNLFVHFGAEEKILYEAHPHIGTNKLPHIITAMRMKILECGGEIHFEKKVTDFIISNNAIASVLTQNGDSFSADAIILATGHSARDIFELLQHKNILIEAKPFALGVRVEHPQSLIDSSQYHCTIRSPYLPPASYSWVQQVNGKGVFSFCMCPGGIIATASTAPGELVVNGWSPSKRNNPFANSGIVVSIEENDWLSYTKAGALAAMKYQQEVEAKAFAYGGGKFVAPAQRMVDFFENKVSNSLPACSYLPGLHSTSLKEVLPAFVFQNLQTAFKEYGKKMKDYFTNEAVVVATESRTSSPVRIPREKHTLQHPQINNLYPCGEGAGYAGGIVSAAMDGENVATQISMIFS